MHPKTLSFEETKGLLDGIDYINVYSKGKTELGRLLSNFTYTPFTYKCSYYSSVEAFWYCCTTGKYKHISRLSGWRAKYQGNLLPQLNPEPSRDTLKKVYLSKIRSTPFIESELLRNKLPFAHYYEFSGVRKSADKYLWTADLWREITDRLKRQ